MTDYAKFFLASRSDVVQLETLEISHSSFSKIYRVVRNAVNGVTVRTELSEEVEFEYYPLRIEGIGIRDNLDFGLKIDLGDLGEILPNEVDRVASDNGYDEKPMVIYRAYRSDNLQSPMFGPLLLEIGGFSFSREGASFEAVAPSLNNIATGELYKIDRFPMLRGFL